uniref:sugar phosphate isomerase/epimerase family protein n=1 Tax=Prosthecobacter sp. TaxID=1965333 RepID=UPI003784D1E4
MNRRSFLAQSLAATAATSLSPAAASSKLALGLDHFAVRATGWKAAQFIDYAASLKLDTMFISELHVFENFEDAYLKSLKEQADRAGLKLYVGTGSVCESSNTWKPANGTGTDHLALTIKIAKELGSPVARCYLGNQKDRHTDGGIQKHIEETIKAIKANQSRAEAEGVKIAIENHAGDMQSHELKALIEAAGKGYVGANIDPGNAVWALEEPLLHLETLGPLTVCSSVRDSMLWEDEKGAVMVQWTAVGEGLVDFKAYAKRFAELAPGVPLQVETISGFARPFEYQKDEFWKVFPNHRDTPMFKAWLDMAKRGKKIDSFKAPDGAGKKDAEIAYQKGEFERSIAWLRANA